MLHLPMVLQLGLLLLLLLLRQVVLVPQLLVVVVLLLLPVMAQPLRHLLCLLTASAVGESRWIT